MVMEQKSSIGTCGVVTCDHIFPSAACLMCENLVPPKELPTFEGVETWLLATYWEYFTSKYWCEKPGNDKRLEYMYGFLKGFIAAEKFIKHSFEEPSYRWA